MMYVAGSRLLERQIHWLESSGCSRVVVEVADNDLGERIAEWCRNHETATCRVIPVKARGAVGPRALARAAKISDAVPLFAMPADLIGNGDLRVLLGVGNAFGAFSILSAPQGLGEKLQGGTVRLLRSALPPRWPGLVHGPGWGVRIRNPREAYVLAAAFEITKLPTLRPMPAAPKVHAYAQEPS